MLAGIRVRTRAGRIETLACDGIRVARWVTAGEGEDAGSEAIILARDAERAVAALADTEADALTIHIAPAFVEIVAPDLTVQIGRLEGRYPDVESLLPGTYPEQARVGRAELAATLGRTLVVGNANNLFLVRMTADEQGLTLEASSPDAGTASDHVAGEASPGFAMNLNGRQLAEAMGHIEGEQVLIESETGKPLRLTGGDARFAYWQMPVRVD